MARILSIDYGLKRIGVAVTDTLQITANGLDTIDVTQIHAFIKEYMAKEDVEAIVLGWPLNLDGGEASALPFVREFYNWLVKNFPNTPVHKYDERYTSVMAHEAMMKGGVKKKKRRNKALVDKISATIILQGYLESKAY